MKRILWGGLLGALVFGACESGGDGILELDATGVLRASVFLDRNGDRVLTANVDTPVPGAQVALVRAQGDTVARAITDAAGVARFAEVPVGRYRVAVGGPVLGDSLQVVAVDSASVSVPANDSAQALATLGFARVGLGAVRALAPGRVVSVEGIAVHAVNLFGDTTIHIVDSSGALRITSAVRAPVAAGDSARFTGRLRMRDGVLVLDDPAVFGLGKTTIPAPRDLSTAQAAGALGGQLDAELVRVRNARLVSLTTTTQGDLRLRVDDGSGPLDVLLDRDARIVPEEALFPGIPLSLTGVLDPGGGGSGWQLKPRFSSDLSTQVVEVLVADARGTEVGRVVAVRGVSLNAWNVYGDSTIHLADASGAIRAVGVRPVPVASGDSIRLVGTLGMRDGQPVLLDPAVTLYGKGTTRSPVDLSTAQAASALSGRADATLARVRNVRVVAIAGTAQGDARIRVDDGSGPLDVLLDRDARITLEEALFVGSTVSVTGLLVPTGTSGVWQLKPRSSADFSVAVSEASVAEARTTPAGRVIAVIGVALNAWNAFGDSTVHVADATGSIRAVGVRTAGISAGDSVRLVAVVGARDGQPVLLDPSVTAFGRGTARSPVDLSTTQAASALGGRADATLARIRGAQIIDATPTAGGDTRVRVDDGSGVLDIILDRDARITADVPLLPGAVVTATGVLVPSGTPGIWQLKPRSTADLDAQVPDVTIQAARATAAGRLVAIRGVALTGFSTFGDATVHFADATGAIRAVNVGSPFVTQGDSIRALGRIGIQDGQPVLTQPTVTVFGRGTLPAPVGVNTAEAASARGAQLDAALVQAVGVRVDSVIAAGQDVALLVSDASGSTLVVLDASAATWGSAPPKGTLLDVTGVLVPGTDPRNRVWVLKPRSAADLIRR